MKTKGKYIYEKLVQNQDVFLPNIIEIRFNKTNGSFTIIGPSISDYQYEIANYTKKRFNNLSEQDLKTILKAKGKKKVWLSDDPEDFEYTKEDLPEKELKNETDLDDDTWGDICFLVFYYCLSLTSLKEAKREYHKYKLNRTETFWVTIPKRQIELYQNRGRKPGKVGRQFDMYNIENYEQIKQVCVAKDRYYEFLELEKDWCAYNHIRFKPTEARKKFKELKNVLQK